MKILDRVPFLRPQYTIEPKNNTIILQNTPVRANIMMLAGSHIGGVVNADKNSRSPVAEEAKALADQDTGKRHSPGVHEFHPRPRWKSRSTSESRRVTGGIFNRVDLAGICVVG